MSLSCWKKFKISKINRKANTMAPEIAKFRFHNRSNGVLLNSVSLCVMKDITMATPTVRTIKSCYRHCYYSNY